jgi:hypothetical protein
MPKSRAMTRSKVTWYATLSSSNAPGVFGATIIGRKA